MDNSSSNESSPHYYNHNQAHARGLRNPQFREDDELQNELLERGRYQQQPLQQQYNRNAQPQHPDRIQKLFNETKELQKRVAQEQQVRSQLYNNDSSGQIDNHYYTEGVDIRENLKYMESQLSRAKENNIQLSRRFEQAQEEIEKSHDQIARLAQLNHTLKLQNEKFQSEIEDLVVQNQQLLEGQSEDAMGYERRIEHLTIELQQLKKTIVAKDDGIRSLQIANDQYKDKCYNLENEVANKIEEIEAFQNQIRKKEDTLDKFILNRGAESALKIECEQLREDNKRLLKLLKQTKEYQQFANYVDDSGGNVKHIPEKENQSSIYMGIVDEDQWLPSEAYSLAHDFRAKNGHDLTPQLVNQLLNDLNKIWREREKKQIARIKQQSQQEIIQLKRQLTHRVPFDEITAKKNISRLQKKLSNVKTELSKTQAIKDKQKTNPMGVDLIDNTLQIITSMQQQRKVLENENNDLRERLRKVEEIKSNQDYDKAKYMEGAVWMGKKITNEIEKVCQTVNSIIQEYNARVTDIQSTHQSPAYSATSFGAQKQNQSDLMALQRAQNWFLEAIKSASMELYEQSITMLESAVFNMEEAQGRISDAYPNQNESSQNSMNQSITKRNTQMNAAMNGSMKVGMNSTLKRLNDIYERNSASEDRSESSEGDPEQMFRATARFQN